MIMLVYRSHKVPLLFRMNGYYLPAVAVMVTVFARERGLVSRLLASRPVVYLSDISFAFYLLHFVLFTHLGAALTPWLGPWPKAGVLVLATGGLAAILFHAVELPLRQRIIRWAAPRPESAPRPCEATASDNGCHHPSSRTTAASGMVAHAGRTSRS